MIAPRTCEVCGRLISEKPGKLEFICKKCELFLPVSPDSDFIFNRFIENFDKDDISVSKPYALFTIKDNSDYLKVIHGFKYSGFKRLGKELSKMLAEKLRQETEIDYKAVIPVPIHHARLRERGFNQSDIIADEISKELNIPKLDEIKRIRYTTTQTMLSKSERKLNITDSIVPNKKVSGLEGNYLLVDDVLTTGSTINVCATVLLDMGASRVDCAVLAVT